MGIRKYKELAEYPKLRVLKRPGDKKEPIGGFVRWLLIVVGVVAVIGVIGSVEGEDEEETLEDFVERVAEEKPKKQEKFILGKINPEVGEKIKELTNIETSKYLWVIENYAARHILNKPAHNIQPQDFRRIYSVVNAPDEIKLSDKEKGDIKYLELYKDFDFKITCVIEVRTRQKELHFKTMFKNRIK